MHDSMATVGPSPWPQLSLEADVYWLLTEADWIGGG